MILFFYGSNDYLLKKKLAALKKKYMEVSKGSFDLVTLEGPDLTAEKFIAKTQTVALFAQTRLVIIEQIFAAPKETLDQIKSLLENFKTASIVVFTHAGEPDKRLGLFKALNKPKTSEYFPALEEKAVNQFIIKEAAEKNAKFAPGAKEYLAEFVGADPWRIANEIEKLAVYRAGEVIRQQDIEQLVEAGAFANTFKFIDALVIRNKKTALLELEKIISSGELPLKVLGAINFQIRLTALIKDELERGTPPARLPGKLKSKPYPVLKTTPLARKLTWQQISRFYGEIVLLDDQAKTGKIMPEEALKELVINL